MALPWIGERANVRAGTGLHEPRSTRCVSCADARWEDRNSGLTENERSDEFVRALAGLVCVGQIGAARAVVAPDVVSC
jgi:hypothetical protein